MTEQNYSSMRTAMVESQLRTSDVDDQRVIAAMAKVPREAYVPAERRSMAYVDRPIPLAGGRALNPPLVTGRLLTEAQIAPGDKVLLIGAATGYAAALLVDMGAVVTAVEEEGVLEIAVPGITVVRGALNAGAADGAPYDVLFIDGAVEEVPATLVQQLAEDARVVTGVADRGVTRLSSGRVVAGALGLNSLVDIEMVVLPGFGAPKAFVF
ncbi:MULTISPECIES: protein-L-isoaspartate O-methyltransferase family protein [Sphingobium]|uniref:Protein-L-isoaspartate O-methyltransferase n=1 Tax=Sphingobium limneticum TaxID=1007511 RepID=A0A5J5I7R6_9SPHN|nr:MULTISPECIES: protein-L-isoaspartate O-methyltransferase [Sphingobium]KAA9019086.1 protein-L-isoaspartate O-methyltransferase [Sphingobium limneticum]KAA9019606.1 protein-L-isoaspartate O-methyltransferase [Sphingobium limneticum]KAA9032064.1 protein-L-isoaspartate O-methyltransferase [Sphingobium limneticum]MBU0932824.1 protein-L-isoaspartate O-methyltransferase [Alphaproteobacteria bacterium]